MFSSTAYEAFYTYIGLHLHAEFMKIITSQSFFTGMIVLIFGIFFFLTAWRFFSTYLPAFFAKRHGTTIFSFAKIIGCLFLGISLLKVGSTTNVKKFNRTSWHTNSYLTAKLPDIEERYEVSFVFDLITRSAEELARFAAKIVDSTFKVTNSQLEAPSYFYKAIMYAGVGVIDDPALKDKVTYYTSECFDKVLPIIGDGVRQDKLDLMYSKSEVDPILSKFEIENQGGTKVTCLDLKNEITAHLRTYAQQKSGRMVSGMVVNPSSDALRNQDEVYKNLHASQMLVNHYMSQHENLIGIHKGSITPGTSAKVFQYLNRLRSYDGLLSVVGLSEIQGAALTAERSQEFSEHLQRAPHIQGFVKMVLIMVFPWLIFFVVAGKWRVLIYWSALYTSVLFWTPIWTLFYHITTNIALSTETLSSFGQLSDGISLYSSQLITSRLYYYYAIYSWVQIILGPLPTLYLAWNLKSLFGNGEQERAPEVVNDARRLGEKAVAFL